MSLAFAACLSASNESWRTLDRPLNPKSSEQDQAALVSADGNQIGSLV